MPSDSIPEPLLKAQRAYDKAEAVLAAAVGAGEPLDKLRAAARAAVVALYRARAGTAFADHREQGRLREAAREGGVPHLREAKKEAAS